MIDEKKDNRKQSWQQLLINAVNQPGTFNQAYNAFHNYSVGNQISALFQCFERGITPGPISTFPGWKEKGRFVRKGEKAITLCMPMTRTKKADQEGEEDEAYTFFIFRPHWFVLSQTDGKPYEPAQAPEWNKEAALKALDITEAEFTQMNGNTQGYAVRRQIAINPLNPVAHKTTFHEIAHVILGHTGETPLTDTTETAKTLQEVEAESVALICCEALKLPGADYSRDYIQHWLKQGGAAAIPEKNAARIFAAADKILKAGA